MLAAPIASFLTTIEPFSQLFSSATFHYFAHRQGDEFAIVIARLHLNPGGSVTPLTHFSSANARAGCYRLDQLNLSPKELIEALAQGFLETPHGTLTLPGVNRFPYFEPLHGEPGRLFARTSLLRLSGNKVTINKRSLDWEILGSSTPYDGIDELIAEYNLFAIPQVATFEALCPAVASVDLQCEVKREQATLGVLLAGELQQEEVTLGYRVIHQQKTVGRGQLHGRDFTWSKDGQIYRGKAILHVPESAVVHCIASYGAVTQHQGWIADPNHAPNTRRAIYELFDPRFEVLNDYLSKPLSKGGSRDLEAAVSWLMWMSGFSVVGLGLSPRTSDAPDLVATTPQGNYVVVECTTGLLKAENKLSTLVSRTNQVEERLRRSGNLSARVLAAIVTSKPRPEIKADLEQAERLGVLVMTREDLEQGMMNTLTSSDADALFRRCELQVQEAQAKHQRPTEQN